MSLSLFSGNAWLFGDEMDTGQILPGKYVPLTDPVELASHLFEDVRPGFAAAVRPGDVLVAGRNFGCGSSREHAPKAIRFSGISAVIADSFARIFFRNALNLGLLPIQIPGFHSETREGDVLEIIPLEGKVTNTHSGRSYDFPPFDPFILDMIRQGGIIAYTRHDLGIR